MPIRSVVCRAGGKRETKGDAPGYKLQKKNESENNPRKRNQKYPIQWEKTKQNRNKNRKASETIIDTTEENAKPGGRSKHCTRYEARRAIEKH